MLNHLIIGARACNVPDSAKIVQKDRSCKKLRRLRNAQSQRFVFEHVFEAMAWKRVMITSPTSFVLAIHAGERAESLLPSLCWFHQDKIQAFMIV